MKRYKRQAEQYRAKLKDLTRKYDCLSDMYDRAVNELEDLRDRFRGLRQENDQLRSAENDLRRTRNAMGEDAVEGLLIRSKQLEIGEKRQGKHRVQQPVL